MTSLRCNLVPMRKWIAMACPVRIATKSTWMTAQSFGANVPNDIILGFLMKKVLVLALFTGSLLLSQAPDITGVWRADLQKSKRMGPPIVTYLENNEKKNPIFNTRTKEEAPMVTE